MAVCRRGKERMKIHRSCFFYANIIWVVLDKLFILKKVQRWFVCRRDAGSTKIISIDYDEKLFKCEQN